MTIDPRRRQKQLAKKAAKARAKAGQGASPLEIPARPIRGLNSRRSPARGDSRSQESGVRRRMQNSRSKNPALSLSLLMAERLEYTQIC
jgi:hypothetical protein